MHTCDGCVYSLPDGGCSREYDPIERERERREMEKIREEWRAVPQGPRVLPQAHVLARGAREMTGKYIVTSTEKLVCRIEVEATSRKDAMRRADAILTHGHYNWESHGTTMKVKKVEGN